ncbi:MAG: CpsD/CapB family tyrosine-protein kinase [Gammaproteobacteria bacterium]
MNAIVQTTEPLPRAPRPAPRPMGHVTSSAAVLSRTLVAALDPAGASAEALRELRSQLILRWFGDKRTLAVLGARAEDDADTVAANLAIAMAQLGEPTLVIDANLRAPRQHELFGLKPAFGLSDLLRNRDVSDEAILPVQAIDNLHVLCAGAVPANPQELVSRTPFMYLMKTLPERFRAIIVATPPALACADAQIIAARTQGCILITRRHQTRVAEIEEIKGRLQSGRATLVGGVIRE